MSTPSLLSSAQLEQIFRWVADGYTDSQIQRMIHALAQSNECDDEGRVWPAVSKQTVAYHRKQWDRDGFDDPGGELLKGTIVGTRDAILRRYAREMGEVELVMAAIEREMHALEEAGALLGYRLRMDEGEGVILGSVLSVDGEPLPQQIVLRDYPEAPLQRQDVLHPDVDPLFQRYLQLGHLHVKQLQAWQRIVQDAARVAGLGFPPSQTPSPKLTSPGATSSNARTILGQYFSLDG